MWATMQTSAELDIKNQEVVSDFDLQALLDSPEHLGAEERQRIIKEIETNPVLQKRYMELTWQKRLLQLWWEGNNIQAFDQ
jgi:hypothetical protein